MSSAAPQIWRLSTDRFGGVNIDFTETASGDFEEGDVMRGTIEHVLAAATGDNHATFASGRVLQVELIVAMQKTGLEWRVHSHDKGEGLVKYVHDPMNKVPPFAAGASISGGHLLIMTRDEANPEDRSKWAFYMGLRSDNGRYSSFGGATDPGECAASAMKREVGEELGVSWEPLLGTTVDGKYYLQGMYSQAKARTDYIGKKASYASDHCVFFLVFVDRAKFDALERRPTDDEMKSTKWITYDEVKSLPSRSLFWTTSEYFKRLHPDKLQAIEEDPRSNNHFAFHPYSDDQVDSIVEG